MNIKVQYRKQNYFLDKATSLLFKCSSFMLCLVFFQSCFVMEKVPLENNSPLNAKDTRGSEVVQSSGVYNLGINRKVYFSDLVKANPGITKLVIRSGSDHSVVLTGDEARKIGFVSIKEPSGKDGITIVAYKNGSAIFSRKIK